MPNIIRPQISITATKPNPTCWIPVNLSFSTVIYLVSGSSVPDSTGCCLGVAVVVAVTVCVAGGGVAVRTTVFVSVAVVVGPGTLTVTVFVGPGTVNTFVTVGPGGPGIFMGGSVTVTTGRVIGGTEIVARSLLASTREVLLLRATGIITPNINNNTRDIATRLPMVIFYPLFTLVQPTWRRAFDYLF